MWNISSEDYFDHIGYRGILWLTFGSLVIPIYLIACILSIIKAYNDRKLIKARLEAKRLNQLPPQGGLSPLDIIAKEVRENRWHKRDSSMTVAKVQSLLRAGVLQSSSRDINNAGKNVNPDTGP